MPQETNAAAWIDIVQSPQDVVISLLDAGSLYEPIMISCFGRYEVELWRDFEFNFGTRPLASPTVSFGVSIGK